MSIYAFSEALALESAADLPYNRRTAEYVLPSDILVYYAKIVAYKVAHNIKMGYNMNPDDDPLDYVNCEDHKPV